jgi:hypothetical protein
LSTVKLSRTNRFLASINLGLSIASLISDACFSSLIFQLQHYLSTMNFLQLFHRLGLKTQLIIYLRAHTVPAFTSILLISLEFYLIDQFISLLDRYACTFI